MIKLSTKRVYFSNFLRNRPLVPDKSAFYTIFTVCNTFFLFSEKVLLKAVHEFSKHPFIKFDRLNYMNNIQTMVAWIYGDITYFNFPNLSKSDCPENHEQMNNRDRLETGIVFMITNPEL